MPIMQRFVSYLYLYENEEKAGNVGFAKIELRGEDCRIEVHMRGTFTNKLSCKIYLFTNQKDFIQGTYIGSMKILNGVGNFVQFLPAGKVGAYEKNFADMDGLIVISEDDCMFATKWKEGNDIPVGKKFFREEDNNIEHTRTANTISSENNENAGNLTDSEADVKTENTKKKAPDVEEVQDVEEEQNECPKSSQQETASLHMTEIPMRTIFPELEWKTQWEKISQEYPQLQAFQEKDITCVRIELKDLKELPKRYWYLGNNSFLLHGFFNYHHLIVGCKKDDGIQKWFLGVPGVYQHQERVMAAIFGFQDFLSETAETERTGEPINHFGYWCRQMDE